MEILKHPISSPLRIWERHFLQIGKMLIFSDQFLDSVARRASLLGLGARGLQQIVFSSLARRAYHFESSKELQITIDEQMLDY